MFPFKFWVGVVILIIIYMIYVLWQEHKAELARSERYIQYLQKQQPKEVYEPVNWNELYDRYYFRELVKVVEEAHKDFEPENITT